MQNNTADPELDAMYAFNNVDVHPSVAEPLTLRFDPNEIRAPAGALFVTPAVRWV